MDLHMSSVAAATVRPVVDYACQVIGITPLSEGTFEVELQTPEGTSLDYFAGQHLKLELDINGDGEPKSLSYSIANSVNPQHPRRLQLFIQSGSEFSERILRCLAELNENTEKVNVRLPMGRAYLQTDLALPHLLVAAGSGIAKVKAITEEILRQRSDADVHIYWSNRNADDFYLLDLFQGWGENHNNLHFTPILESAAADWSGRSGYIYEVIEEDFDNLTGTQAYLCGSPQMVYGTIDKLKTSGLNEEDCYSDVFEYAPRN